MENWRDYPRVAESVQLSCVGRAFGYLHTRQGRGLDSATSGNAVSRRTIPVKVQAGIVIRVD